MSQRFRYSRIVPKESGPEGRVIEYASPQPDERTTQPVVAHIKPSMGNPHAHRSTLNKDPPASDPSPRCGLSVQCIVASPEHTCG